MARNLAVSGLMDACMEIYVVPEMSPVFVLHSCILGIHLLQNGKIDGWFVGCIDGCMDECIHALDEWMDAWNSSGD